MNNSTTNTTTTTSTAPTTGSLLRKMFGTTKQALNVCLTLADVAVDVTGDALLLGAKCVQSTPAVLKEVTQLPKYTRAQIKVNEDTTGELTHEAAIAVVEGLAWKSPADMFKDLGIATGNAASAIKKELQQ